MPEGPRREAVLRGFMALVMDMVRVEPERKPSTEMLGWYRDLAHDLDVEPIDVPSARVLLEEGLRLMKAARPVTNPVALGAANR